MASTLTETIEKTSAPQLIDQSHWQKMIAEIFSTARDVLVDLLDGKICTATYQFSDSKIYVTTPNSISTQDLQVIKSEFFDNLEAFAEDPTPEVHSVINGKNESSYKFDKSSGKLLEHSVYPVSIQTEPVGLLFVGSLDHELSINNLGFLDQFSRYVTRALRHLCYLNNRRREQFQLMVSRIVDGVILCNSNGKIKFINKAAKKLFHADQTKSYFGVSLKTLEAEFLIEYLDEAQNAGIFELNKVTKIADNKNDLIGVHVELLKNSRNHEIGWLIILRDVTKNWQNDQMRSALSVASHEIKTPLHSILGAVDMLLDHDLGEVNKQQRHCLKIIRDDINRLNRLLTDILDVSRFDEGLQFLDRRTQIALGFLVNKVIELFKSYAKSKNIQIENKIPKTLPTFRGNRDRLQQVIVNLLENSIKYSLPGGKVTIEAEVIESSQLKFKIQDTGVGIPPEDRETIFERFKQLSNNPEEGKRGNGLGLSIAKEIIEAFKGKIWVESEVGKGSTFYFLIPV